eukprot:9854376-Prorocentrum_lima.AAC.1
MARSTLKGVGQDNLEDVEEQLKLELAQSQTAPQQMQTTQKQYNKAKQAREKTQKLLESKKGCLRQADPVCPTIGGRPQAEGTG